MKTEQSNIKTLIKTNTPQWPVHNQNNSTDKATDHFMEKEGVVFAGCHLIIDLWGASYLDNLELMENVLRESVKEADAHLLHIHLHHFTPTGGISGVAVLAESHISVHTWPEKGYAAFDVFMCGDARPDKTINVMKEAFLPENIKVTELMRGIENI